MTRTLYVSPLGHDAWSGRLPEPSADGNDGPLATLARARDLVRALPKTAPIRVLLRGGVHELAETLTFRPEDSGTVEAPIIYGAYPGEQPVISGGRTLGGWQVGEANGQACWTLTLPEVAQGNWYFTQLFVNGERRFRSRLPKQGYYHFTGQPDGHRMFDWYGPTQRAEYQEGDIQRWKNLDDVEIVSLQFWFETHLHIKELDEAKRIVTFTSRSINDLGDEGGHDCLARYVVENVGEALSEPGEWYLDRSTGVLIYLPMPGETPERCTVVAPKLDFLVQVLGSTGNGAKVSHLRFENLDFRYADWRLPKENPGAVQAAFNVPAAIHFRGAEHCALYGCDISRIGQYAVEVMKGSYRNRIIACAMHDLGAGGVKIAHESWEGPYEQGVSGFWGLDPVALGWGSPDDPAMIAGRDEARGMYTTVADCSIHDGGRIFPSAVGIWIGNSGHNQIIHNEIYDLYYSAISCGWNWNFAPTFSVGNRIEYNHIYNIGRKLLSDMGAIYTLGLNPGGTIRGNHIHDVSCYGYGGCGIYPDQGSSFFAIEDNVVHHTQTGPFSLHYGRDLTLRNNIFALSQTEAIARSRQESVRAVTAERNIVYLTHADMIGGGWSNGTGLFRNNLYWRKGGLPAVFNAQAFTDWQESGQDAGSSIADPLFLDPEAADFTLRSDSPALAMGFQPIDLTQVGPRFRGTRPTSIDELLMEEDEERPIVEPRLEVGEPTFPTIADRMRLANTPSMMFIPVGEPVTMSLTLVNRGHVSASGSVAVVVTPATAGRVVSGETFSYALQPGERSVATFQVVMEPQATQMVVETRPSGEGCPASAQHLSHKEDLHIARLSAETTLGQLADILAGQPPRVLSGKQPAAEVRMGVIGETLALSARVIERDLAPNPTMPWAGSGFEMFTPGHAAGELQHQYFLTPAGANNVACGTEISFASGSVTPITGVQIQSQPTPDGYVLQALIPFAALGIPADAAQFEFELYVNTVVDLACGRSMTKMFGAINNCVMGMDGFGMVYITGSPPDDTYGLCHPVPPGHASPRWGTRCHPA